MNSISQTEKLDVLLVLALAFENTYAESEKKQKPQTILELTEKSFGAMLPEELSVLKSRAEFIDKLPDNRRELWREICLEKLLRRGKSIRLDENINPVHIVNVLSREPQAIQKLILRNLPPDLSRRIAQYLELKFEPETDKNEQVHKEIAELLRQQFLSNFVSLDDIYEPTELDRLSVIEIVKFIHHLGLREVAIACRGISSKETLAAFLNSFAAEDTREIVRYLTELDKVKPFWVAQADEMVRDNWETEANPEKVLEQIGFKLLAVAFANRDEIAQKYTMQKFSTKDSYRWKKILREIRNEFVSNDETKLVLEKRQRIVERLAVRFIQTGRL